MSYSSRPKLDNPNFEDCTSKILNTIVRPHKDSRKTAFGIEANLSLVSKQNFQSFDGRGRTGRKRKNVSREKEKPVGKWSRWTWTVRSLALFLVCFLAHFAFALSRPLRPLLSFLFALSFTLFLIRSLSCYLWLFAFALSFLSDFLFLFSFTPLLSLSLLLAIFHYLLLHSLSRWTGLLKSHSICEYFCLYFDVNGDDDGDDWLTELIVRK